MLHLTLSTSKLFRCLDTVSLEPTLSCPFVSRPTMHLTILLALPQEESPLTTMQAVTTMKDYAELEAIEAQESRRYNRWDPKTFPGYDAEKHSKCIGSKIVVLSGAPGAGKTTLQKTLCGVPLLKDKTGKLVYICSGSNRARIFYDSVDKWLDYLPADNRELLLSLDPATRAEMLLAVMILDTCGQNNEKIKITKGEWGEELDPYHHPLNRGSAVDHVFFICDPGHSKKALVNAFRLADTMKLKVMGTDTGYAEGTSLPKCALVLTKMDDPAKYVEPDMVPSYLNKMHKLLEGNKWQEGDADVVKVYSTCCVETDVFGARPFACEGYVESVKEGTFQVVTDLRGDEVTNDTGILKDLDFLLKDSVGHLFTKEMVIAHMEECGIPLP